MGINRFAFILPYIGKLPSWFQLWLNSCARNPQIDWLLFIDDRSPLHYPDNVIVNYCSFAELRQLFQEKFPFKISLEHPYRFCDFRPSFGIIFEKFITNYIFWGHCDPDLIWGNIQNWLFDDSILRYDRISHWGHCSLYKNTEEINSLYKTKIEGVAYYRDVYSNGRHIAFDEEYGMNLFVRTKGIKEFVLPFFDVKPCIQSYSFTPTFVSEPFFQEKSSHKIVKVSHDGVWVCGLDDSGDILMKEMAYVHLQKRKMKVEIDQNSDSFLIVPNSFVPIQEVDSVLLNNMSPSLLKDHLKRQALIWKSRMNVMKNYLH